MHWHSGLSFTRRGLARLLVLACCAGLVPARPVAAREPAAFDVWSVEDGLPQGSVNDILQTRDGYLWLATFGGLVRFDGARFVVFDRSVDGIRSLRTRVLYEDRTGVLWAGTDDGMVIRFADGHFRTFDSDDGLPASAALRIEEDEAGVLWITWLDLVTRFDGRAFETLGPSDFPGGVAPRGTASDRPWRQSLWWSLDADGLRCLTAGRVRTCVQPDALPEGDIVGVTTDNTQAIWVHLREGVVRLRGDDRRFFSTRTVSFDRPVNVFEDRSGAIWFLGLASICRVEQGACRTIADLGTLTAYQDREGSIWFGSIDGLRRLRTPSVSLRTVDDGLSSNNVYSLLRDRLGATWIGTWGDGLNRLRDGRSAVYRVRDGLPSDYITSTYEDSTGRLWVGTDQGLSYREGDRFVPYTDPNGWLASTVWTMHEDAAGGLWFGTEAGLVRRQGAAFTRHAAADGLAHDGVMILFADRAGTLWIGTRRGLSSYRAGAFSSYTEREGFVGNHVRAIHEDADGALWVGTYDGGLYRVKDGQLARFTSKEGLHDNGIFQILEDADDNFWIGSNRGIFRVNRHALNDLAAGRASSVRSIVLGIRDGLTTLECNGGRQPSSLRMDDGTFWIPTQGGVAIVDPARVRADVAPPPVLVEEFHLRGDAVPFRDGVEASADRNSFEIRYTATSFVNPDQVRFRYRLVGLDDQWIEAGANRSAAFYRVPPGRYEFQVTAAGAGGIWNPTGDSVTIVMLAPFWRSGVFLGALGIALVGAVVVVERRRTGRLRSEHDRQQAYARQLLETQERERRRISNELHDSLGQTLFMIRKRARAPGEGDRARPDETLDDIAGLAGRAYDDMKEIAYDLRPYQLDKIGLSKTIAGMLRRMSAACGIDIQADIDDLDGAFPADDEIHVFRIVQEAVNNIARHAGATEARVRIARRGRVVDLEVTDNGRGFHVAGPAPPRDGAPPFGLTGIRERAARLGGQVTVRSGPGQGTSILVRFRSGASHDER
jgi:signal transduction histidine kinase/ligand-binding sensor domain-containing protein